MGKITIHAGDFPKGDASVHFGIMSLPWSSGDGFTGKTLDLKTELEQVDVATEETVKKIGGTLGWGAVGAIALGPVGLLAGLLLGGRKSEVTFVAIFKGGKKMLGTTDNDTFKKIIAASFK